MQSPKTKAILEIIQQLKWSFYLVSASLLLIVLNSCNGIRSGDKLSKTEIKYIKELGLLDSNENIILFETHSGRWFNSCKTSGNFISDKRLASYWIDKNSPQETSVDFAYYDSIDTMTLTDLSHDWSSASYMTVRKKNGREFKLFIDGNRSEVSAFFRQATKEWTSNENKNNR